MKSILFDLDGTLVDSSQGILNSFRYTFKKCQLPELAKKELLTFIGPPLETTFENFFSSPGEIETAIHFFRSYYSQKGVLETALYDNVKTSLQELTKNGHDIYVTTSKHEPMAKLMLNNLGVASYFKSIYGSIDNRFKKVDVIKACLHEHQPNLDDTFIVGDTTFDIMGGQSAGIKTIAASWGFGKIEDLESCQPDYLIHHIQDIKKVIG